jgi:hypothetical protein
MPYKPPGGVLAEFRANFVFVAARNQPYLLQGWRFQSPD